MKRFGEIIVKIRWTVLETAERIGARDDAWTIDRMTWRTVCFIGPEGGEGGEEGGQGEGEREVVGSGQMRGTRRGNTISNNKRG